MLPLWLPENSLLLVPFSLDSLLLLQGKITEQLKKINICLALFACILYSVFFEFHRKNLNGKTEFLCYPNW